MTGLASAVVVAAAAVVALVVAAAPAAAHLAAVMKLTRKHRHKEAQAVLRRHNQRQGPSS